MGGSPPSIAEMIGMGTISIGVCVVVLKIAVESIKIPTDLSHIEPGIPFNPTLFLLMGVICLLMLVIHLLAPSNEVITMEDLLPPHYTLPEIRREMP
jgi:hypothetical protein